MNSMRVLTGLGLTAALAACSSGDITLAPTNIDNSTSTGGGGGGQTNPCASYAVSGVTRQGSFDGTNVDGAQADALALGWILLGLGERAGIGEVLQEGVLVAAAL